MAPDPGLLFDVATGSMRAKHMFVASKLGAFEKLVERPATLEELTTRPGTPVRTTKPRRQKNLRAQEELWPHRQN